MALNWVRLDANIATNDKILALLDDPSGKKWQAATSYVMALAWSGGQETDGFIPKRALRIVHGTPTTARLLETYSLWHEAPGGWTIHNWAKRQPTTTTTESRRQAALKANCIRHHGKSCGCWQTPNIRAL